MATLFMDNFEVYGQASAMIDGMYAELAGAIQTTYLEGTPCLFFPSTNGVSNYARKVLDATYSTIFTASRIRVQQLPVNENLVIVHQLRDVSNANVIGWYVDTTGRIVVKRGDARGGVELARTVSPVIGANTWHHVEIKWVINATTGSVQVRVDDNDIPAINVSGVNTGSNPIAQFLLSFPGGSTSWHENGWITDLHVWDTTGTRNVDFLGDVAVSTLWPNEDIETGWTPNYRHKIGQGVLATRSGTAFAVTAADSTNFELGSGDYTLETFVRFNNLPSGTNRAGILTKWYEGGEQRSYDLSKCGPALNSGNLEFRISTTGAAGGIQTIHSVPWEPETDRWYHVAVVRASGENMIFIDGIMQNVPQTDGYTYFNGTAVFGIAGITSLSSSTPTSSSALSVDGWLDETRVTKGVARYTENFVPTTVPFGRNSGTDPDFASVVLLAGYDQSISDESSFAVALTPRGTGNGSYSMSISVPDDGEFQYQTINAEDTLALLPPRDDTNISASLYHADGILTLDSLPIDGNAVTIGYAAPETYKFVDTLVNPYDVLIGVDIPATLHNLVAAINEDTGSGTIYGSGTVAHTEVYAEEMPPPQCKAIALLAGAAGNDIAVSYDGDGAWDDSTLTGGQDIPGPSSFRFTRMPPGVTSIRSIMSVTRAYKTDAGPAKMKTNFVGPLGAVVEGTEVSLPNEPAYRINIYEEDPDTTGPITPATLVQGRVQFDRTE